MVSNVTSLTRSGLRDWLWQRISALVMLAYVLYLGYMICALMPLSFGAWHNLFSGLCMQAATFITGVALLIHIWVGMWTVATDYIKPSGLRILFYGVLLVYLSLCFYWLLHMLWGL